MTYAKHFDVTVHVPQSQPLPGREPEMVKNAAGGYAFAADQWTRLSRFLMIGTEGGTFYEDERSLTLDNAKALRACIAEDGNRVVQQIVDISHHGKAVKNSPAIFALALCAAEGSPEVRQQALSFLPVVCRTGTHLFEFIETVLVFRGWGRGLRNAVARWYNGKPIDDLALQLVKYRQRNGWTHRDVLRTAHVTPDSEARKLLLGWAAGKPRYQNDKPALIEAFERAQAATSAKEIVALIRDARLPREAIPTQFLNDKSVWEALLQEMPMTAMIRNLGKMSAVGLFDAYSTETQLVVSRLSDRERIHKARVHPLSLYTAAKVYESGRGMRGSNTWGVNGQIVAALGDAFEASFDNVAPINKNVMVALDVSGSMSGYRQVAGLPIKPIEAAAALALVYLRAQPNAHIMAFDTDSVALPINKNWSLETITRWANSRQGGGTNCSIPFTYAVKNRLPVDAVIMVTDGESWVGHLHTSTALKELRKHRPVRLVEVRTTANDSELRDPKDADALEMAGFSPDCMTVAQMFFAGQI